MITLGLSISLYAVFPKQCVKCQRAELAIILSLSLGAIAAMLGLILFSMIHCFSNWNHSDAASIQKPMSSQAPNQAYGTELNSSFRSTTGDSKLESDDSAGKPKKTSDRKRKIFDGFMICILMTLSIVLFVVFLAVYLVFMIIPLISLVNKSGTITLTRIVENKSATLTSIPSYLTNGSNIEILRDYDGIIYLTAESRLDMLFGQGFACAQDRLFQMDLIRRAAQGRLSEIAGEVMLEDDKLARQIGFAASAARDAQYVNEDVKKAVQAYSDGVNAYLQSGNAMPFESTLLGYTIEPWTLFDSLCVVKYIESLMSFNRDDEDRRFTIMKNYNVTIERMEVLDPPAPIDAATILTREDLGINTTDAENKIMEWKMTRNNTGAYIPYSTNTKSRDTRNKSEKTSFFSRSIHDILKRMKRAIGSNNWSVHKNYTDSQSGYTANDPHLELQAPDQVCQFLIWC